MKKKEKNSSSVNSTMNVMDYILKYNVDKRTFVCSVTGNRRHYNIKIKIRIIDLCIVKYPGDHGVDIFFI